MPRPSITNSMPEIDPETFKELLALFVRGHRTQLLSREQQKEARKELNQKLLALHSADPLPFPLTYSDFRHQVTDQFLEALRKEDPWYRRPRF
jgi:hypothetical protein